MILCAGLSPSWQQIYELDRIRPGAVNRARHAIQCPSGKVLNAAIAAKRLGGAVRTITTVGGPLGRATREELERLEIESTLIEIRSPTRLCTTLIDHHGGQTTELVQNAPPIDAEELEAFHEQYGKAVAGCGMAVLLGSLPPGAPPDTYRRLIASSEVPVIADFRGPELLEALREKPFLIKPNREELEATLGRPIGDDRSFHEALVELERRGARWILVSAGAGRLVLWGEGQVHHFTPARVKEVNPIGSGDTLSAALALALVEGQELVEATRFAIGAATANVTTAGLVEIQRDRAEHYASLTEHRPVSLPH